MKQGTIADAAVVILKKTEQPMTAAAIAEAIVKEGLYSFKSKNVVKSVHTAIVRRCEDSNRKDIIFPLMFRKGENKTFALKQQNMNMNGNGIEIWKSKTIEKLSKRSKRQYILNVLCNMKVPVFIYSCYHDMGCDFKILSKEGYINGIGSNWPAFGSWTIQKLKDVLNVWKEEQLLMDLLQTAISAELSTDEQFFAYKDERDNEPALLFKTLEDLAIYFVSVTIEDCLCDVTSWKSMTNEELEGCYYTFEEYVQDGNIDTNLPTIDYDYFMS